MYYVDYLAGHTAGEIGLESSRHNDFVRRKQRNLEIASVGRQSTETLKWMATSWQDPEMAQIVPDDDL
jgi:hypothetical protein